MDEYCSNTIEFKGDRNREVLEHFRDFSPKVPPFIDTSVAGGKVKFKSPLVPPIRDLNAIAERFDVSYKFTYQTPGKSKETFSYVCLAHETLSPVAETIRDIVKGVSTIEELEGAKMMVAEILYHRSFDLRDLGAIASALAKRTYDLEPSIDVENELSENPRNMPWESDDISTDTKRHR